MLPLKHEGPALPPSVRHLYDFQAQCLMHRLLKFAIFVSFSNRVNNMIINVYIKEESGI